MSGKTSPRLPTLPRRRFIQATGAVAGLGLLGLPVDAAARGVPRFGYPKGLRNPFTLGVASGDPRASSVVLWTRLAPDPLNGGGMPERPTAVKWVVATDPNLNHVVKHGWAVAAPGLDHSVHATVRGLQPNRWYYYAFVAGPHMSTVGRTRTLPRLWSDVEQLSFAFVSCQEYQFGYYTAYKHMAQEDLDFVIHLGDYLYETGNINPLLSPVRSHENIEVTTLEEYRRRYTIYKLDPQLQAAHAAFPFIHMWDDHEVDNDWAGEVPSDPTTQTTADFLARRAVAAQVFYENLPLGRWSRPRGPNVRLHRTIDVGSLARISLLDTRQFRSDQPCGTAPRANPPVLDECSARLDPNLTMLGTRQEGWLLRNLRTSRARWNVIASTCWFSQFRYAGSSGQLQFNTDQWDGYPVARQRVIDYLAHRRIANPVFISGDWHVNGVMDVLKDFDRPTSAVVAAEFGGTSISSVGPWAPIMKSQLGDNLHVKYLEGDDLRAGRDVHGYVTCHLDRGQWLTELRVVDSVKTQNQPIRTVAQFVIQPGVPGAARI